MLNVRTIPSNTHWNVSIPTVNVEWRHMASCSFLVRWFHVALDSFGAYMEGVALHLGPRMGYGL